MNIVSVLLTVGVGIALLYAIYKYVNPLWLKYVLLGLLGLGLVIWFLRLIEVFGTITERSI